MELARTTFLIYRTHLWRTARAKRSVLCALLAVAPAAFATLALTVGAEVPAGVLGVHVGWFLILQLLLPLVGLVQGAPVVAEEVEDRTITFPLARPIPRSAVLLGRWGAAATIVSALVALSVGLVVAVLSWHPALGAQEPWTEGVVGPLLAMAVVGGLVYSALFAVVGILLKHPMIIGLGYTFAVEGLLANFPGNGQSLTIQFHLRSYVLEKGSAVWREIRELPTGLEPANEALATLAIVLAVALAIGVIVLQRRQFVLPS